tara:strand:+ start:1239 stop:1706 length:468 start_codon:yes stop_codon:yes gene_type:complete
MNILYIIISALPFLISLPYSLLNKNKFNINEKKALWQPPGYVFGIVWPILYLFILKFNYILLTKDNFFIISSHILTDSFIQGAWLYVFQSNNDSRGNIQYIKGLLLLILLNIFAWYRLYYSYIIQPSIAVYYIPYVLWIMFALVLNYQLYYGITK